MRDALLAPAPDGGSAARRPRRHDRRPARADPRAAARVGRFHVEHRHRLRHRRRRGVAASGWRSPPSGPTATTGSPATPRWPGATRWSTTWPAGTSRSTPWPSPSGPTARSPTPSAGWATCWPGGCARPVPAVDSFADDPLRMLRAVRFVAQLGPDAGRRGGRGDDVAGRRAGAGSPPSGCRSELSKTAAAGLAPGPRWSCSSSTGLADVVLPELSALRMEIDEHHQHKDVYTHSLIVLDQAIALEKARSARRRVARPGAAAGGAAARHRQAGDAAARGARPGVLPPPRGGRRQAGAQAADARCATPRRSSRRSPG